MKTFENFNLKEYNSYRLNAFCSKVFFPENESELISLFTYPIEKPRIILGNGNNIILAKEKYDNEIIIFNGCFENVTIHKNEIIAEAGATMLKLSEIALENSLKGLEVFYDIPSSVGGAIVMNAGAGNEEIKDILVKVRYFDTEELMIKEIDSKDLDFDYRNSYFQKNSDKIVLKAWFRLSRGNFDEIETKMKNTKLRRWEKQPRNLPNCGSVFKRPKGRFVGPMIDELGLRGFKIGGAMISEKHSGFIVNYNNASGADIIAIINEMVKRVKEKYGIALEVEQRII